MTKINSTISYAKQRPILIGLVTVCAVLLLGSGIAFGFGFVNPSLTHADDSFDSGIDVSGGFTDVGLGGDTSDLGGDFSNGTDISGGFTDVGLGGDPSTGSDVGNAPDTSTTESPNLSDTDLSPCNCDTATTISTDVGNAPDTSTTESPNSSDTDLSPCNCDSTPPVIDTPPTDTQPIVVPPIIVPPIVVPPSTPECASGDTGTYPNCVPPPPPPVCPTGDTGTYPNCVVPPPPPAGASCVSLTASATSINSGDAVTLSWVTSNASSISIDNGVGSVTPVASGSIVVNPTTTTTYNATVPGAAVNSACSVTVTVTTPICTSGCGGGGGGGGGGGNSGGGGGGGFFSGGGVSGSSIVTPLPVAVPASMVYLSQIPYTGLDLGPVGTVVYWALLILWCVAAAYLIIFMLIPFIYRRMHRFGTNVNSILNTPAGASHDAHGTHVAHDSHSTAQGAHYVSHAAPVPAQHTIHSTTTTTTANPSAYSAVQGFRSFAQGETLTIDDIVNGLSRLPNTETHTHTEAHITDSAPAEMPGTYQSAEEVITSHAAPAAVSSTRKELTAAAISTDVRDFCAALLAGNRDVVFGTIRQIVREGGDAEVFLTQVVCSLDDAYRNRVDGTPVNAEIARITQGCATSFLERLTGALTNAVDSSYSAGITGSKLALTRALAVVEG